MSCYVRGFPGLSQLACRWGDSLFKSSPLAPIAYKKNETGEHLLYCREPEHEEHLHINIQFLDEWITTDHIDSDLAPCPLLYIWDPGDTPLPNKMILGGTMLWRERL